MSKIKTISGKVSYTRWNLINGKFKIGNDYVYTGNMVRLFTLRSSKWAEVLVDKNNALLEILDGR